MRPLILGSAFVTFVLAATAGAQPAPVQATVPLHVEGNRPYVDVTLRRVNGSMRVARFLVDSGGGGFLLTEPLARDLGLTWGRTVREEGSEFAKPSAIPSANIGGVPLDLDPARVSIVVGESNMVPRGAPGQADGLLPGHVLAKYHVVFDYPAATFAIARPGVLTARRRAADAGRTDGISAD